MDNRASSSKNRFVIKRLEKLLKFTLHNQPHIHICSYFVSICMQHDNYDTYFHGSINITITLWEQVRTWVHTYQSGIGIEGKSGWDRVAIKQKVKIINQYNILTYLSIFSSRVLLANTLVTIKYFGFKWIIALSKIST